MPGPSDEGGFPLLRLVVSNLARKVAFSLRSVAFSPSSALTRAARVSTWAATSLISVTTSATTASRPS